MSSWGSNCERCDADQFKVATRHVTLMGGVSTCLCTSCETEWDEVCQESDEIKPLRELDARMGHLNSRSLAGIVVEKEEVLELAELQREARRPMRLLALSFIGDRKGNKERN